MTTTTSEATPNTVAANVGACTESTAALHRFWAQCTPATTQHAYLKVRRLQPHGLRVRSDAIWSEDCPCPHSLAQGRPSDLLVPVMDRLGKMVDVQRITWGGDASEVAAGPSDGHHLPLGRLRCRENGKEVYIFTQSFEAAATIYEATGHQVLCCFSIEGMLAMAKLVHAADETNSVFILAVDNDADPTSWPERRKAMLLAIELEMRLAMPPEGRFNDLYRARGSIRLISTLVSGAPRLDEKFLSTAIRAANPAVRNVPGMKFSANLASPALFVNRKPADLFNFEGRPPSPPAASNHEVYGNVVVERYEAGAPSANSPPVLPANPEMAQLDEMLSEILEGPDPLSYEPTLAGDAVGDLRQIARLILRRGELQLTRRDVLRFWKKARTLTPEELDLRLCQLCTLDWLAEDFSSTGLNGLSFWWAVNPRVHDMFANHAAKARGKSKALQRDALA